MLDGNEDFQNVFMGDTRQLGMLMVNLIENLGIEQAVAQEANGGWTESDLNAFFDNQAGPTKEAFGKFVALLDRRNETDSKAVKLKAFWEEQTAEMSELMDETESPPGADPVTTPEPSMAEGDAEVHDAPQGPQEPDPPTPANIGRNIRAAVKKSERKLQETLKEAGIDADKMFLAQYEKGNREISGDQMAEIARLCEVTEEQLQTGEGLEDFFPKAKKQNRSLVAVKQVVELPPFSPQAVDAFFRDRTLGRSVEPAEGVEVGELLELARGAMSGDEIDWFDKWLTLTKNGAQFKKGITSRADSLKKLGDIPKVMFIKMLVEELWPKEEES